MRWVQIMLCDDSLLPPTLADAISEYRDERLCLGRRDTAEVVEKVDVWSGSHNRTCCGAGRLGAVFIHF